MKNKQKNKKETKEIKKGKYYHFTKFVKVVFWIKTERHLKFKFSRIAIRVVLLQRVIFYLFDNVTFRAFYEIFRGQVYFAHYIIPIPVLN